ncbi:alpha/beta hydrolase [Ornithinimicrobium cryptoxanthini]|uniref:Alpha/beta fold hydrolase n=1 Tax=Ornithinimicrobium cryptoxanthini TaxID=2934161 RepID=A0ABY4YM86_9MICO|nr:alpha/beta fold hydrolase [Ornithinimicrobium cryptoxanthini]USQ77704.1 alpha/beta fold hydrolase [Ornithinimicrobium cryptoxanthini]
MAEVRVVPRLGTVLAVGSVGVSVAAALASLGVATYFARRVVTPEHEKKDDTWIVSIDRDGPDASTITFVAAPHTLSPGRYGLWLDHGEGHARVGDVISSDLTPRRSVDRTVVRELLDLDEGRLVPGPARWNSYYYCGDPGTAVGLEFENVHVPSDIGDLPAWLVPPREEAERPGEWAVLVHGRSAKREETIRALPLLHDLGFTSLVPKYRNDQGAPPSADGRYNLGLSEWRDIEAAIIYAVGRGAKQVTLLGWSMGGAIVLQTLDRSDFAQFVNRVVLDCPVIDWGVVLTHNADLNKIPRAASMLGKLLMGRKATRHLVGVAEPLDIAVTNWVARSDELRHPMLLMHSRSDDVVPFGPSEALAEKRPDLITLDLWDGPLHCREWNTDTQRWEQAVRDFLA